MKFSTLLSSLVVLLPFLLLQASGASVPILIPRRNGGGGNANNNGRNGKAAAGNATNTANNTTNTANNTTTTGNNSTTAAVDPNAGNVTNIAASNNATGNAAGGDPQTSLTLDPRVIAKGFANDGQSVPVAGQIASKTSTNNFINFCLTVPNLPITNGQQITTGSCNPAPMGIIPSSSNMPSAKFTSPKNGDTVPANKAMVITMAISNMATGNFVNAQQNFFAAPQQLSGQGTILGHSHVVVESLTSLTQTTPTDPTKFAFFKGLNSAASGGILSASLATGLPAGAYRLCSINTAANHQPVLVPIAQHGALDDCVYFAATAGGAAAPGTGALAGAGSNNTTTTTGANNGGSKTANTGGNTTVSNTTTTAVNSGASSTTNTSANTGTSNTTNVGGNANNGTNNAGNGKGRQGGKRDILRRRFDAPLVF